MSRLTCLTCQVGFTDNDLHRLHFKGDWHRYNLKRKVAGLPTVTADQFQERKEAHEKQSKVDAGVKEETPRNYCICCRKSFGNSKAYTNHISSKKHKEMVLKFGDKDVNRIKEKAKKEEEELMEEDSDCEIEEVDSDEWDEYEDDPIPTTDCLFCMHHSANIDNNVKHMVESHSFFLPDAEYITNLEGLLDYLAAKVGQGYMCLWCSERSKAFQSVDAVQKHMQDKGHCKLKHEGESLIEYAEFYDYSVSYPEGGETGEEDSQADEEVDLNTLDDSGYQLTLPSGAIVGHRSLLRYYRQSLNPNRSLVPVDKSAKGRFLSTYRAFGWTGTNSVEVAKKARDIKFMARLRNKSQMQLGWKANRLQTHFRDRNGMCQ